MKLEHHLQSTVDFSEVIALARRAGQEIMKFYRATFDVSYEKGSPVTAADNASEALIQAGLARLAPHIQCISEESFDPAAPPEQHRNKPYFIVDPLDGTNEFIEGRPDFTVNIALVENGRPIAGVVAVPATDTLYFAHPEGPAMRQIGTSAPEVITCRDVPSKDLIGVASRSHMDDATRQFLANFDICELVAAGSSIKFCRIAEGAADIYPRFGRTMEWDTAAAHAVLLAAGGSVETTDGAPLTYGKAGCANPAFLAWGRRT